MFTDLSPPHLRATVKNLSLFSGVSVVIFASASIIRESYVLAALEFFASGVFFFIWWSITKQADMRRWGAVFTLCVCSVMLSAMAAPDTGISVFGWICVVSIASYSILGSRVGFVFTLVFDVLAIAVFSYRYSPVLDYVSVEAILNVSTYSLAIWICSHIYETSRERARRELLTAATQDPLTGLLNRARLQSIFDFETKKAAINNSALCLLMCDLDHFKSVNDKHGHNAGDEVLIAVANSLKDNVRDSDYVFRLGGEEFLLMLPDANLAQSVAVANHLRGHVEGLNFCFDNVPVLLTMSVGVAQWGGESANLQTVLREADLHLYQAKSRGRNIVIDSLNQATG